MTNKEQNTTPPQSDGTACPVTDDSKEWLLRLKSQDAEIQKLRSALQVAREALTSIAAEDLPFPDAVDDWTKKQLKEVVCTDTEIARDTLTAIDVALKEPK